MLDTMTFTKTVGALCGALLVFLLGAWAAEVLYHPHTPKGQQAYVIDTGGETAAADETAEAVDFETLFAAADPAAGERLWRQCASCHALEPGRNGTGPYLHGVVGRDKGSVEGFRYSAAMASAEGTWEPENISAFIENPRGYIAGTSMAYAGMRRAEDRANLIAYLATFSN
jgi:cytochrome c